MKQEVIGLKVLSNAEVDASEVTYDNTVSGMDATDVQAAIDELKEAERNLELDASQITYDNATSGMNAADVQAAIDELKEADNNLDASQISYDNTVSGMNAVNVQAALNELQETVEVAKSQNDYSLEERDTGSVWIDGSPIYKRTILYITTDVILNGGRSQIFGDRFPGMTKIIKAEVMCDPWLVTYGQIGTVDVGINASTGKLSIQYFGYDNGLSAGTPLVITLYYLKEQN